MKPKYACCFAVAALCACGIPMVSYGAEVESGNDSSRASTAAPETSDASSPLETMPVDGSVSEPETPAKPAEKVAVRSRVIEEVVVTAQKREENLQDVPISIQAFSGGALAARGIQDTTQLGQAIPGLQFTTTVGFQLIYIRGVGTDNFVPSADPSVATYVDGMYVPLGQGATQSLGNVSRIEVLKGPQGTLFGRNATGGAISVYTADPGKTLAGSLQLESGNFNLHSVKASIDGPVADWLSLGISGIYSREDSYYSDIFYRVPPSTLKAGRGKALIQFTDDLKLSLTTAITRQAAVNSQIGKNVEPSVLGRAAGIQPQPDDYTADEDFPSSGKTKQNLYYGTLTWALPWFDLKVLGSDQSNHGDPKLDYDGSRQPAASFSTPFANIAKLQTGELQFVSNDQSWAADVFKWTTGLYYFRSHTGYDPVYLTGAPGAASSLPAALRALLPVDPNKGVTVAFSGLLDTDSYSGYAQGTYTFTNWLDFTLGGRGQYENRKMVKSTVGVLDPTSGAIIPGYSFPLPQAASKNFAPKAVLSFHPIEDQLLYLSYSVGYKSGTFNVVNISAPPDYIKPEKVNSYEVGAKLNLLEGNLRLNSAAFYNDITNLQSGFVSLMAGGAVRFLTVPHATTYGAEADGTWVPLPSLLPGMALTANAAYVDAKYTDFKNGQGFNRQTGAYESNQDYTGNRIVRNPQFTGGVGLVQTIETVSGPLELAVDDYYNSGFYFDSANTVKEGSYSLLNARASILHEKSNVRFTAFAKNVLGERYHVAKFQTDFGNIYTLAAPRQYGLRLNWDF